MDWEALDENIIASTKRQGWVVGLSLKSILAKSHLVTKRCLTAVFGYKGYAWRSSLD